MAGPLSLEQKWKRSGSPLSIIAVALALMAGEGRKGVTEGKEGGLMAGEKMFESVGRGKLLIESVRQTPPASSMTDSASDSLAHSAVTYSVLSEKFEAGCSLVV